MKEKFNGDNPINARIKIDYSGVKPKVRFSYPDKKNQFRGDMLLPVFVCWVVILFVGYIGFSIAGYDIKEFSLFNENNKTQFDNYTEFIYFNF